MTFAKTPGVEHRHLALEPASGPDPADPLFREFIRLAATASELPPLRDWVDLAEAWRIASALELCRGNRSAAARALGIGRRTLYTKMEKLGITEAWNVPRLTGQQ